jgi:hypothetical protein
MTHPNRRFHLQESIRGSPEVPLLLNRVQLTDLLSGDTVSEGGDSNVVVSNSEGVGVGSRDQDSGRLYGGRVLGFFVRAKKWNEQ